MKFSKMQGIGNDYLYFNCFEEKIENPSELAIKLSDRHFGVGSDGIILIEPSDHADCRMDIYNSDGSRAMMCGNGIRCVGKYLYERGLVRKDVLKVDTLSGVKTLFLDVKNGIVHSVKVDMGKPVFRPAEIPVIFSKETVIDEPITVDGNEYRITCVSMGNPHCILFVDDVDAVPIEKIGPELEHASIFPDRANIEFVQVLNSGEAKMRVWERGAGETWACGTGACASAISCAVNHKTGRKVKMHLKGGDLSIEWDDRTDTVFMQGPAEFVFDGTID
ncbi:diaminopimelate epimerase [Caproiciproducens galactitolivorans]|uniref:Diaminopimelate epimerase n=1 Tax=Caproiciproducens galactitolivorans TaxID=642589 RepID=A0A4Z0YB75_9FIRM|nr:diaminopimelate epimerase [Caproiciproducens galactitolivorans]QEY33982.1 diaminopimelate epimerase [Caproiciproducens galactitolivorans]TGJ76053.1 diaminopimelate epimerase [Caproiciproducens galactitolivorans]